MANETGLSEAFEPTAEQRQVVDLLKAFGTDERMINKLIINPATGKPVAYETFRKVFEHELLNAKMNLLLESVGILRKSMYSKDEQIAYNAAAKNYQLRSKGLLEPKSNIQTDDSNNDKINKIIDSLNTGALSTFEADSMIKAIEVKTKVELEEIHKQMDMIKAKLKEKGIEI